LCSKSPSSFGFSVSEFTLSDFLGENHSFYTEKEVILFLNCYSWKTVCMLIEIKKNSHIKVRERNRRLTYMCMHGPNINEMLETKENILRQKYNLLCSMKWMVGVSCVNYPIFPIDEECPWCHRGTLCYFWSFIILFFQRNCTKHVYAWTQY
jgi:hypothetical protein